MISKFRNYIRNIHLKPFYFCLLGYSLCSQAIADEVHKISNNQLEITPVSCVIEVKNTPCTKKIILNWALPTMESFCIYIGRATKPISCHHQQKGQTTIDYPIHKSTHISFISPQSSKVIASGKILVSRIGKPNRRPKNRHAWSIF